jgi:hypothetical protein
MISLVHDMIQRKYKHYVSAEEKLDDMALGCQQGPGTVCACWLFEVGW